jgi:hypothetical protein
MTPTDEAHFIALWAQGASYRELAAALGCPLGTVASRAAALVAQGKIQLPPGARSPAGPAGRAGGRGRGRRTRPAPCGGPPGPTPHLRRRALRGDTRDHDIRWNVEIDIEAVFSLVEEHPPPRYLVIFYVPEMYMAPLHRCPIRLMIIGPVHKSSIVDPFS